MNNRRYPYPIPNTVKQAVYYGVRLSERAARGIVGTSPRTDPCSLRKIRNFLLPQFQVSLGCTVHATPIVEALHQAVPDARIVGVMSGLAVDVFRFHPGLERIQIVPNPSGNLLSSSLAIRRVLADFRDEPYCVVLTGGDENVRASVALATLLSGNGIRVGINVASPLLHLSVACDKSKSQIENLLRIPEVLGYARPDVIEPRVYFSAASFDESCNLLSASSGFSRRPLAVMVTQTSVFQRKGWREERFIQAARRLTEMHDCRIVLVGSLAEVGPVAELRDKIGGDCLSVAGKTSIATLAALLAQSDVLLTLDTGILHVARAVQLPACIIAPAWSPPHEWLPLGNPRYRILKNLNLPATPPLDYMIDEVSAEEVCAALDELIHSYPPSESARKARIQRSLANPVHGYRQAPKEWLVSAR